MPGGKGEGIEKYTRVATNMGVQSTAREYSQQYCNNYVGCRVHTRNIRGTLCEVCDCLTTVLYT